MRGHARSTRLAHFNFTLQSKVIVSVQILGILRTYSFYFLVCVFCFHDVLVSAVQQRESAMVTHTSPSLGPPSAPALRLSSPATVHAPWEKRDPRRRVYPGVRCRALYTGRDWKPPRCPPTDEWGEEIAVWMESLFPLPNLTTAPTSQPQHRHSTLCYFTLDFGLGSMDNRICLCLAYVIEHNTWQVRPRCCPKQNLLASIHCLVWSR